MKPVPSFGSLATGYCALVAQTAANLPKRVVLRRRYAKRFGVGPGKAPVAAREVAALVRIKNEDFWIELILRVVCKVFPEVVIIDSGSQDQTLHILDELAKEGLNFRLFCHREPPHRFTVITNLVVDSCVRAEWVYLIDGDEIQFEKSGRTLVDHCQTHSTNLKMRRIACHQLLMHPTDVLRCTPPLCKSVPYMHGRVYRRQRVYLNERGLNDALVAKLGPPGTNNLLKDSAFLESAFTLHCPLNQRSTIATYRGYVDLLPQGETYRAQYRADDEAYIRLPFFPKEIHECKYSGYNYYLALIREANIPSL